jgi:hypothetical protein
LTLWNTKINLSAPMRYGKNKLKHVEIDPSARRAPGQSLKKAAPGAPFGWNHKDEPYQGTQYEVSRDGKQLASVSTRNGGNQKYWQPMQCVSAKVAMSALETHGTVEGLRCEGKLTPALAEAARKQFVSRLGEPVVAQFESLEEEPVATPAPAKSATGTKAAKSEAKSEPTVKLEAKATGKRARAPKKAKAAKKAKREVKLEVKQEVTQEVKQEGGLEAEAAPEPAEAMAEEDDEEEEEYPALEHSAKRRTRMGLADGLLKAAKEGKSTQLVVD